MQNQMNKVEKFKKFLEDNGAYDAFVEQTNIPWFNFEEYVESLVEEGLYERAITRFSFWNETKEGIFYWGDLSDKWQEVCNEQD